MYKNIQNQQLSNAAACWAFGWHIASQLQRGDILALQGPIGSGKTLLTKGIATGLGIEDEIVSPSYNIIHEYPGMVSFYHIDLYRLEKPEELEEIDIISYFHHNSIVVIEWPQLIMTYLPSLPIMLSLTIENDNSRTVQVTIPTSEKKYEYFGN